MKFQKYLLKFRYDGTGFAGYQRQPGVRTVQSELERALEEALGRSVALTCAGRTDKGVHARGQVVRFKLPAGVHPGTSLKEVNRRLGPSIQVAQIVEAPAGFHPRHSALSRTYAYYVTTGGPARSGVLNLQESLDLTRLKEAAEVFVGSHDFSTFSYRCGRSGNVRRLHRVNVQQDGATLRIGIQGQGFLRKMVRLLVGGLLECGTGRMEVAELASLLRACNPELAPHPAPACGLHLESIEYDPDPFQEAGIYESGTETADHGAT
ncbi:MAG: tRNA pseudouridine(38-40) synthase TruA [Candidatus Eremiobacteraeota bacterium]|nr:tRNA pseudouridine(38-40) synthase TruA [Candidatus Eremiobacteraeota bacterium]